MEASVISIQNLPALHVLSYNHNDNNNNDEDDSCNDKKLTTGALSTNTNTTTATVKNVFKRKPICEKFNISKMLQLLK